MGQNFSSEPVIEKVTEREQDDTFNVAVSSCQGWRMTQEDNHSLMLELPGEHKAAFFAVFDGHGSARVSKHASESLWRHLVENEMYIKGNFKEALEQAFLTFDREVNDSYNAQLAGTTAVCLLVVNNVIYCANIGDSRGVASVNCRSMPLSYDHKPENPQELKRILAAGGYVLGNRVNGNLALSRAFGDFHYKGNDQLPPEQQIVSPCPDIKTLELNDDVDFLVLACDGIWDVLSSAEVVEFILFRLENQQEPGTICEQLTTRCLATDYELVIGCDNMTVLLICYTRGRSWAEYCTDIFNKNSIRMGMPSRKPHNLDPSASGPIGSPSENDEAKKDVVVDSQNSDDAGRLEGCQEESAETTDGASTDRCPLKDSSPVAPVDGDDDGHKKNDDDLSTEKKLDTENEHESECQQEPQNEISRDSGDSATCNKDGDNKDSDDQQQQHQQSGCKEETDEPKEEQTDSQSQKEEREAAKADQNLECETK